MYYALLAVYVLVCLLLLLVVLLQQGKGGDMASAFGGSGSQTAFGARGSATVLTRATTVLGVGFILGALVLVIIGRQGPGSVVSGIEGPAPLDMSGSPALPLETTVPDDEPATSGTTPTTRTKRGYKPA